MTTPRAVSTAVGGLSLLALLLVTLPAEAKRAPGLMAPEVEGKDFFNTDPTSLRDQRGRLVFLELFSTT